MQNFRYIFFIIVMTILFSRSVSALIIYESATYSETHQITGDSISSSQPALGSRFYVDQPVQVTAVGGHIHPLTPEGSFFAALVSLDGPSDYPKGKPLNSEEVIASTVFQLDSSGVCDVPLSASLKPGYYAIVLGTNLLGAQGGNAYMPNQGQTNLPGNLGNMYFVVDSYNVWLGYTLPDRFVVEGVPEPATLVLFALGGLALLRKRR